MYQKTTGRCAFGITTTKHVQPVRTITVGKIMKTQEWRKRKEKERAERKEL